MSRKKPKQEPREYERASLNVLFIFSILVGFAFQILLNSPTIWYAKLYSSLFFLATALMVLKSDFDAMVERRLMIESMIDGTYWEENLEGKEEC